MARLIEGQRLFEEIRHLYFFAEPEPMPLVEKQLNVVCVVKDLMQYVWHDIRMRINKISALVERMAQSDKSLLAGFHLRHQHQHNDIKTWPSH